MKYIEFRDTIQTALNENPAGLTWIQLRDTYHLPYKTPCQSWVYQLETEIHLKRNKGHGRSLIWKITI